MKRLHMPAVLTLVVALIALAPVDAQIGPAFAPEALRRGLAGALAEADAKRPFELDDILAFRAMGLPQLSTNGQWLTYRLAPLEGDAETFLRSTQSDKEMKFAAGQGGGAVTFSDNSKWAVVTISPNNPRGAVYPEAALREVNAICRTSGIWHIHDEAYEYFTYGVPHFSPSSIPGAEGHTISLYSLSKAYGFASWRIGYMLVPDTLFAPVRKIQDTNVICPAVISSQRQTVTPSAGGGTASLDT